MSRWSSDNPAIHRNTLTAVCFLIAVQVHVSFAFTATFSRPSRGNPSFFRKEPLICRLSSAVSESEQNNSEVSALKVEDSEGTFQADSSPQQSPYGTSEQTKNTKGPESTTKTKKNGVPEYDLPWSDLQQWALRDQLPKYTVNIPIRSSVNDEQQIETLQVITLWRTMANEVVELSGYPLEFLVERQMEMQIQQQLDSNTTTRTSPTILPYLNNYEFTPSGGLSGVVSGVAGIADGSRIETAAVGNVERTIRNGYVQAGPVLYELGQPAAAENTAVEKRVGSLLSQQPRDPIVPELSTDVLDKDVMNLGILTATVVAGAVAFESLSHHLTVNVFWV